MSLRTKCAAVAKKAALVVAASAVASTQALAAIPAGVTDAIDDSLTDVNTIGAAVIIVLVGIAVWKWARRAL